MSAFPAGVKPEWAKLSTTRLELRLISKLTPWVSHYDHALNRSRKCAGPTCLLCAKGCQKQLRVVVMGLDKNNREILFELRERHREMFDHYESSVGLVCSIRKAGGASNSKIEVVITGEFEAMERDIRPLVSCFGLPPILMGAESEETG